jgi:propionyl-CoA carboxylase alpha chain
MILPSVGHLMYNCRGRRNRVDNGFEQGWISIYYDLMLPKLINGETREEAIQIMVKAIDGYLKENFAFEICV